MASADGLPHARCRTVALAGMSGSLVDVEVHIGGVPGFVLIGRPDSALQECRDRVRAAVLSSGEEWPQQRITANLSPAGVPKHGSHFDLPLAVGVLAAAGGVDATRVRDLVLLGELALDGRLRPVRGVLPAVAAAASAGLRDVVVPEPNVAEARQVDGVSVLGPRSLSQVLAVLRDRPIPEVEPVAPEQGIRRSGDAAQRSTGDCPDLSDVAGQPVARRVAEVAAAGRHHLCLVGPPGCGKTMLAERLPGLLPDLAGPEALEVSAVHSLAGSLDPNDPLIRRPPFVSPHHTASAAAIVGGGTGVVRPGAASLAHRGLLLLDEAPEFNRRVLESLRQPLESGSVVLARSGTHARFPAAFQLVLTANPCPCGRHGVARQVCSCPAEAVRRYRNRLSGPLLDRVDIRLQMSPVTRAAMAADDGVNETSAVVAARVQEARGRQRDRAARTAGRYLTNGDVPTSQARRWLPLAGPAAELVQSRVQRGLTTARGAARLAKVAWTIADLAGAPRPSVDHVHEALALQSDEVGR